MRAKAIISFGLFTLLGSSALAIPSQLAFSTTITKRQVEGGDDGNDPMVRPAEWDDLPRLPAALEQAYERNAEIQALAILQLELVESPDVNFELAKHLLEVTMTYLDPSRVGELVERATGLIRESERASARGSKDTELLARTRSLDLKALERELAGFVRFRNEHESIGSPGQETWRNPLLRREGQPLSMISPYHSLTESQDRLLVITKALSGRLDPQQILRYLLNQDPFLEGHERRAFSLIQETLGLYKFTY